MDYNRDGAVAYALGWAVNPNPAYPYIAGNDCTNFISQCLRAGGAGDDFNPTHPWWYRGGRSSLCWTVAGSLYWYIRTRSDAGAFGVKAQTQEFGSYDEAARAAAGWLTLGDLLQYRDANGAIRHTAIVTAFDGAGEPLITQHTLNIANARWRKPFPRVILHHITGVN